MPSSKHTTFLPFPRISPIFGRVPNMFCYFQDQTYFNLTKMTIVVCGEGLKNNLTIGGRAIGICVNMKAIKIGFLPFQITYCDFKPCLLFVIKEYAVIGFLCLNFVSPHRLDHSKDYRAALEERKVFAYYTNARACYLIMSLLN